MPTRFEGQPPVPCPECGEPVEPRTVIAFDPRLREVTIERARCWNCGWERARGPDRRQTGEG